MEKKPLELRILGATELIRLGEPLSDGIVRQPKRLALLAYLAINTGSGFRRRDEVIGIFWPELDQTQGRTYLRKALHAIREELGDDLFMSRGDDEIRVNEHVLWCDAVALIAAHSEHEYRDTLELYRGELLPGLYPEAVAQEFEEWLRRERKSLREKAASAAWNCSRAAENDGSTAEAAVMARRALEIEPDNEEGVRRLMSLLDRRGDRAGALRYYKDWQSHLLDEFGVEPAPETRKLARSVQAARKGESHETPPATPQPVRKSFVSAELHPLPAKTSSKRKSLIWPAGSIALIMTAIAGALLVSRTSKTDAVPRSVMVAELRSIGASETSPTARAITEELATRLAMDTSIQVRTAESKSSLARAAYVVEGAVQQNASRVRVTIRVLRRSDGVVVWGKAYDAAAGRPEGLVEQVSAETIEAITTMMSR